MKVAVPLLLILSILLTPAGVAADEPAEPKLACPRGMVTWMRAHRLRAAALALGLSVGGYFGVEAAVRQSETVETSAFATAQTMPYDIAVYGDSLCQATNGYCGILPGVWETRTRRGGWPNDNSPDDSSPYSLFERLRDEHGEAFPLRVWNASRSGAYIDPAVNQSPWVKRNVFMARDLKAQVTVGLGQEKFARVHLISLGVNNLDFAYDVAAYGLDRETYLKELPGTIATALGDQLDRLVAMARLQTGQIEIVVFALPNLEKVIEQRNEALKIRETDKSRFPFAQAIDSAFPSFKAEHQSDLIALNKATNAALEAMVKERAAKLGGSGVRLRYSEAIFNVNFNGLEDLALDALHPADSTKTKFAGAVHADLKTAKTWEWISNPK